MNNNKKISSLFKKIILILLLVLIFSLSFIIYYENTFKTIYLNVQNDSFYIKTRGKEEIQLPQINMEGYEFLGWFYEGEEDKRFEPNEFKKKLIKEDIYLKPKYLKYSKLSFDTTFNEFSFEPKDILENTYINQYLIELEKPGYIFIEWININNGIMPNSDLRVVAKWERASYFIIYNSNNQTLIQPQKFEYEENIDLSSLPIPTKENKTFLGWYMDDKFLNIFDLDKMPSDNIYLYARWSE